MKKSQLIEEPIVFALKQAEPGTPVLEVCHKIEAWRIHYNQRRPHSVLGCINPARICWEVCRLPEHAARLKPVMPDYDWIIFGVRVRRFAVNATGGAVTGASLADCPACTV